MQRKKEKEEKEKAEQEAKEKELASSLPDVDSEADMKVEGDEGGDEGIKEPEKEPIVKKRRNAHEESDMEHEEGLVLERETSGLSHLRRRPLEKDLRR